MYEKVEVPVCFSLNEEELKISTAESLLKNIKS